MGYFTIKDEVRDRFEEEKSIFIGSIKRVYTEGDAKKFICEIKNKEKEAKHNVYAYVIGENMNMQRYSDDGEPQGTAGLPILGVIKKNKITNTVLVVTRYFGGILLGRGGLFRAYSKSASRTIEKGKIIEKSQGVELNIVIDYENLDKVKYVFKKNFWYIEDIKYSDKVNIIMYCESKCSDKIINNIIDITSGKCKIIVGDEEYYFKLGNRLYKE